VVPLTPRCTDVALDLLSWEGFHLALAENSEHTRLVDRGEDTRDGQQFATRPGGECDLHFQRTRLISFISLFLSTFSVVLPLSQLLESNFTHSSDNGKPAEVDPSTLYPRWSILQGVSMRVRTFFVLGLVLGYVSAGSPSVASTREQRETVPGELEQLRKGM
jgi:hypothetical protein